MQNETNDFYCDFVLNNKVQVLKEVETENVLAFHHTKPSWTTHIVIVPKAHISELAAVTDMNIIGEIFEVIQQLVLKYELNRKNFRIVTNGGDFQDSKHLHFHLLSGEAVHRVAP